MVRCGECDGAAQPGTAYLDGVPYCERHYHDREAVVRKQLQLWYLPPLDETPLVERYEARRAA